MERELDKKHRNDGITFPEKPFIPESLKKLLAGMIQIREVNRFDINQVRDCWEIVKKDLTGPNLCESICSSPKLVESVIIFETQNDGVRGEDINIYFQTINSNLKIYPLLIWYWSPVGENNLVNPICYMEILICLVGLFYYETKRACELLEENEPIESFCSNWPNLKGNNYFEEHLNIFRVVLYQVNELRKGIIKQIKEFSWTQKINSDILLFLQNENIDISGKQSYEFYMTKVGDKYSLSKIKDERFEKFNIYFQIHQNDYGRMFKEPRDESSFKLIKFEDPLKISSSKNNSKSFR